MTEPVKEDAVAVAQDSTSEFVEKPRMPSSIPFIITNEMTERFTFYGMKSILMIYMISYLGMSAAEGSEWGHWFMGMLYMFPFFGAILADGFLGKYRVIFWLSIVYCFGPFIMALPVSCFGGDPKIPLFWGLLLIALGAGESNPARPLWWVTSSPRKTSRWSTRCLAGSTWRSTPAVSSR